MPKAESNLASVSRAIQSRRVCSNAAAKAKRASNLIRGGAEETVDDRHLLDGVKPDVSPYLELPLRSLDEVLRGRAVRRGKRGNDR